MRSALIVLFHSGIISILTKFAKWSFLQIRSHIIILQLIEQVIILYTKKIVDESSVSVQIPNLSLNA